MRSKQELLDKVLSQKGKEIYFPHDGILAQSAQAKGKKINATIGVALDDQKVPFHLSSVHQYLSLPPVEVYSYAPSFGIMELRKAWLKKINLLELPISLPVVTQGITHALSIAGTLFINPQDEVLLPYPCWENYNFLFGTVLNGKCRYYPLFSEGKLCLKEFKVLLNGVGRKKIVVLNFPHNPSGYSLTKAEAQELITIIREAAKIKDLVVICDDAYAGFCYEAGIYSKSLFDELVGDSLIAIKVDGASKELYGWGLRVGFITFGVASKLLEDKAAGLIRATISNVSLLSQNLILSALRSDNLKDEQQYFFSVLKKRYDSVKEVLGEKNLYFNILPFNSGYFFCLQLKKPVAEEVRQVLLTRYDCGVIAPAKDLLRVAYSSVSDEDLLKLIDLIVSACRDVFY